MRRLRHVLCRAVDLHAWFLDPGTAKVWGTNGPLWNQPTAPPTVSLVKPGFRMIALAGIGTKRDDANNVSYTTVALTAIRWIQQKTRPCG